MSSQQHALSIQKLLHTEHVTVFKLLRIYVSSDPRCNHHVNYHRLRDSASTVLTATASR